MTEGGLTPLEQDALVEVLNIGVGRAAASLAQMVGEEVSLSIPRFAMVDRQGALAMIGEEKQGFVAAVRQTFHGPFHGSAMLIYPEEKSLELVRSLLNEEDLALETLTELERESLLEVGNVILNACLGSIANLMEIEFSCELPEFLRNRFGALLGEPFSRDDGDSGGKLILFLFVDFVTHGSAFKGYVVLLLDVVAMVRIKKELGLLIQRYQG